jgi:hypothetical protein
VVATLLMMDAIGGALFGAVTALSGVAVAAACAAVIRTSRSFAWLRRRADGRDLVAIAFLYLVVVGLLRLAFGVFTTDRMLWFFVTYAAALFLGVAGPVVYQVFIRGGSLADLGIGAHRWRSTAALALLFASVQFSITLWGFDLPRPVDWVPLLTMAITVGVFEAVFFRGFIQGRLEASFGVAPAVLAAAGLYGLYHVGYGMGVEQILFLTGLGITYAVAYRLTENVLILWPLLTPLGYMFAELQGGDLRGELPWASMAGFGDVLGLMVAILWLARRRERKLGPHHGSCRRLRPHAIEDRREQEERHQCLEAIGRRRGQAVDLAVHRGFAETEPEAVVHRGGHSQQYAGRYHPEHSQEMSCH